MTCDVAVKLCARIVYSFEILMRLSENWSKLVQLIEYAGYSLCAMPERIREPYYNICGFYIGYGLDTANQMRAAVARADLDCAQREVLAWVQEFGELLRSADLCYGSS